MKRKTQLIRKAKVALRWKFSVMSKRYQKSIEMSNKEPNDIQVSLDIQEAEETNPK